MTSQRIPSATYRVQFNRNFGFLQAAGLLPYLHALGVSDLYASPLLKARPGSPHGYDVTDPARLNPELGGDGDFSKLVEGLGRHGMGLLLDIVPNHMAASSENPWFRDVLQNGENSPFAAYFDIDWRPLRPGLAGKVLLPILGEPYGRVLENRELSLELAEDGFWVTYHDRRLPLSPGSTKRILNVWAGLLAASLGPDHPATPQIDQLRQALKTNNPSAAENNPPAAAITGAVKIFWRLRSSFPEIRAFLDGNLEALNGTRGDPRSFDLLDGILAEQFYRLAFWRTAGEDINYRRFFDVSDLVSIRTEVEEVFEACHSLVLDLAGSGRVTGLRIDHIDGLYDPGAYLARLRERLPPGVYVVVEKILGDGEEIPARWQACGTTGYDFLNKLNGIFVDRQGIPILADLYVRASGLAEDFETVAYSQKKRVMEDLFPAGVRALVRRLGLLAEEDRFGRDLTLAELEQALVEITACLKVYRTYTRDFTVAAPDRDSINRAAAEAVLRRPPAARACRFLRSVLLLEFPDNAPAGRKAAWLEFVMRWQQLTGPVMAKGYEDTALYLFNRLVSLNEVGGDPGSTGTTVQDFHLFNKSRRDRWPHTMNATSTHDTKRSEDVRARINVLSEIPAAWAVRVERWRRWNQAKKPALNGRPVPDGNTELFIYQTLVGAWPLREEELPGFKERFLDYLVKASREAKSRTSWVRPDPDYEEGLREFAASILDLVDENLFLRDFREFQRVVAFYGALGSLGQVLLKIASPGVPDFYQGTELWNFSLVDPDNRRPVDFRHLSGILAGLKSEESRGLLPLARKLLSGWEDGRVKLYLTYRALNFRKVHRELFTRGEYTPLEVKGHGQDHACAFARHLGGRWVLAAAPRLLARLATALKAPQERGDLPAAGRMPEDPAWGESCLVLPEQAPAVWRNIFTGEAVAAAPAGHDPQSSRRIIRLADVFRDFPAALLAGE